MTGTGPDSERISPQQQLTVDYMRMAGRRSNVHGLVEIDVTDARERIRSIEDETGTKLSFTAFVVSCLAATVAEQPHVHRYRDWRGRLHEPETVDVNVLVEREVDGERIGAPHVLREANRRTVRSIHDEIRRVEAGTTSHSETRLAELFGRLPGVLRRQLWRLPSGFPDSGRASPVASQSPPSGCSAPVRAGPSAPRTTPSNSLSAASEPNHA
ncbi:hypothetical protein VB779_15470 [Haloarculaceae archaeon H-GB11]|nr:hypothetical protein [Haloarculaceae archaeon H-GB11]